MDGSESPTSVLESTSASIRELRHERLRLLVQSQRPVPAGIDSLAVKLGRLVEAQRRFAGDFGLAYGCVFPRSADLLHKAQPHLTIRAWLANPQDSQQQLDALLDDLLDHQQAVAAALEGQMLIAAHEALQRSEQSALQTVPLWLRILRSVLPEQARSSTASAESLRRLCLVAPAFVTAYSRVRERESTPSEE